MLHINYTLFIVLFVQIVGTFENVVEGGQCYIEGTWKMVYTTALDVLSLAASPFTLLQGIYQVIKKDGM